MFVVLATNTNQDNTVFGPYKTEKAATQARNDMAEVDHLHVFNVMEVTSADEED
jgi:hypothetical protein